MKIMFAAVSALALCAASQASAQRVDRNVDMPIARSVTWFGYVGGDDIRSACTPGARSRVRLVYNALWEEQVRTYELFLQPDGTAGLNMGVLADQGDVSNLLVGQGTDVLNPWRMKRGQRLLDVSQTSDLMASLQASSAFGPPRDGLRLPDNDFWWTVSSCRNGVWGFQAYHYPTDGFANVRFAEKLFALDNVPVAINRPRKLEPAEFRRDFDRHSAQRGRGDRWILVVGKDGLRPR
ncbi:MAG TPA: hypothetical protein VMI56_10545 [Reyranella sp.]|nr:hypothetical protein [Reyranella sp.]